jgi:ASC-1-like (ASCH) protein
MTRHYDCLREEQKENAFDSMDVNSGSISNEIDESELQWEKDSERRIGT